MEDICWYTKEWDIHYMIIQNCSFISKCQIKPLDLISQNDDQKKVSFIIPICSVPTFFLTNKREGPRFDIEVLTLLSQSTLICNEPTST